MQIIFAGLVLLAMMNFTAGTCVLESEFGFILNCNFKKSGLFRVRNLGGLKAHFGLGFSLGDELGFGESLGNLEGNRRRALNYKTGFTNKVGVLSEKMDSSLMPRSHFNHVRNVNQNTTSMTEVMFLPLGVPTFKPIPKVANNLVRRKDVILSGVNDKALANLSYTSQNTKYQSNAPYYSPDFDVKIPLIEEHNMFGGLQNISNKIQNTSEVFPNEVYNKNQIRKINRGSSEMFDTMKHSTNYNITLTKKSSNSKVVVVMNAPKEYYPSGYDKNFDDNFKSKVELPQTDFACADQKYFPGLYANINLGCMVFHVCAVTDVGIMMKSFLCPESTLFDQSILKCNWWFYVDCVNSTYESNIPISKSYQLMKSLSYVSNYTKIPNTEFENTDKNVVNKI